MRLWQNYRLDGTFEAPTEQIVAQFRVSDWWTADLDLDSAVRGFLTDIDGPINAVWDDEADLAEICAQARAAGWSGAAGAEDGGRRLILPSRVLCPERMFTGAIGDDS